MLPSSKCIGNITDIAKYLCPQQVTADATKFEIDAHFLEEDFVRRCIHDNINMKKQVRCMFPHKKLDYRATKLHVRTADSNGQGDVEVPDRVGDKKEGYLGTLVVVITQSDYVYTGGMVSITTANGLNISIDTTQNRYAVAAGGSSTVSPVTGGSRISMHYDIYDVTPEYDPLVYFNEAETAANSTASGSNHPLATRTTTPERVKSEVLAAVEAELATSDAVVIALQHLYSEHQHNNDPSYLKGGDRALYNILASAPHYTVRPVKVTLQSGDAKVRIVSGTYSSLSAENTKLIVPVALYDEHSGADKDAYTVTGLRVAKKL